MDTATLGVLLAGGRGTRLRAGVPKALVEVGGRTLLAHAIAALVPVCDEIVIAAPADVALPPLRHRRVTDGGEGPLGGLVGALESADWERAIVVGVDFPLLRGATLAALAARIGGYDAVRPATARRGAAARRGLRADGPPAARRGLGRRGARAAARRRPARRALGERRGDR